MQIDASHHIDASEQRADGLYDYFYEYDVLVFREKDKSLIARTYADNASEAHFLKAESGSTQRLLTAADFDGALAAQAVAHLRGLGKTEINWLGEKGFEPVPSLSERLP